MTLKLRPYQEIGRDFLAGKQIGLLADEMRVGKTPQAILAAHAVGARRVLTLSPAIAVPMWIAQWDRWWSAARNVLTVMSFERALMMQMALLTEQWDVVIIDEAQFAGNPAAKRTRMIYGKDGLAWRTRHLWALSGTPAPKHAGSLWPLLACAGVTIMDYDNFIRKYCRIDYLSQRPVGTKEEMIDELRAMWQIIGLRRTRKEVAPEMPDIDFEFLEIEPDEKVDLPSMHSLSDDAVLAALESQANVDRDDRQAVAMAKTGPLLEEVEAALGNDLLKQTVIFGWHIAPLKKIVACLNAMGFRAALMAGETSSAQREKIQEQFAVGLLDVVVGQIRACGTAIDLSAASHCYFLELDWLPGNNLQAANRLVAIGKDEKVTADICTWPGSVDDRLQRVLMRRAGELNKLFA